MQGLLTFILYCEVPHFDYKNVIEHYPNPSKKYTVYTDASDDACGAQVTQEHDGMEFPIAFLSHTLWKPRESGVPLNKRPMESITT